MEAKLYGQNKGGISINGIIKDYYAYAGENISAGDLVEYVNGVAGKTDYGESEDTQLSTTAQTGSRISAVEISENTVFVAHSYGSSYHLYGVVVNISGSTITYGTDIQLSSNSYSGYFVATLKLDENRVFIAHNYSSSDYYLAGLVVNINNGNITTGTDTIIANGTRNTANGMSPVLLSDDKVFIAHSYGGSGVYYLYGIVCTIDGTTITKGTDTAINSSTKYTGLFVSSVLLPNGNVFIAHSYSSSYYHYGIVCTISGTTISKGTDTALNSSTATNGENNISACVLNDGKVFVSFGYTTSIKLAGIVCSVSGTSISKGTLTTLSTANTTGKYLRTLPIQNNKVLIVHGHSDSSYLYGMICTITGTSITGIVDTQLSTITRTGVAISPLLLTNNTMFIPHSYTSSFYLYAQIFGIDEANNILTNNISILDYETQIRKVTTGQFDGIAKTEGTGGDDTEHNDLVSIWTKEGE